VATVELATGPTMLDRFVYALDPNGNRTAVTHNGGTETYTLDELDRITRAAYPNGDAVDYAYDPNGNRLTQKLNGSTVATYVYDDADQLLSDGSIAYAYDANGNLTAAGADTFQWDWADRLSSATVGGQTTTYAHAADGVRAGKTAGGTTTGYLWDRQADLPVLVGDGGQSYLHAGGVLAGIDGAGGAAYPLADGLGSVRLRTDGAGAVVGTAGYDVFGAPRGGTGAGGTFGFAGEQRDPETGQVHLRARPYAPGLGRFLARDPVMPNAPGTQGWNPYAYAANNPTTLVDPSGRCGQVAFVAQAALAAGTGGATATASLTMSGVACAPLIVGAWVTANLALVAVIILAALIFYDIVRDCTADGTCGDDAVIFDWLRWAWAKITGVVQAAKSEISIESTGEATREGTKDRPCEKAGPKDRSGKGFTRKGKRDTWDENKERHGGVNRCDICNRPVYPPKQSEKGVTPSDDEGHVDHRIPKHRGGAGDPSNGQILCRKCNCVDKGGKYPYP
jgi:RHS repeat-associated protein